MGITTASEGSIRIAVKAGVALLVEDEDDTLVADIRHLIGCNTVSGNHVGILLGNIVQTIYGLEGLPHTGIVDIVEYRIGVLCRTTALEVHTTDILTTLYPTSREVRELRIEIVVCTVSETTLSRLILIVLGSHQDFRQSFVRTVNTSPLSIQIPIVGSQRACSDNLIAERDNTVEVGILIIL